MDASMGPFSTNGHDSSAKYIADKAGSHNEAVIIGGVMIGSVFFVAIVGVACMFFKERARKIKDQQAATKTVSASEYKIIPTSSQDARLVLDWLMSCHKPSLTSAASNHTQSQTYLNPMQDSSQLIFHPHMKSHSVTDLEPRSQKAISPLSLVLLFKFSNETDPRPVHDPRWAATVHSSQAKAIRCEAVCEYERRSNIGVSEGKYLNL
ncbi:uncharacterized protein BKA55DRAFT_631270 [Fusarium redolens]|uniref:Uncharacterized protein n=1 Tax=Fusarium redolens TaxID=48865 RepID=A0A9P9R9A3_FUSRE|nr:uncharacterized protein BKA55DRAFT_631270 [Fusarium redolens]KAH7270083.1 hypothetical protein BKA55DRAFT_631270 [Fusarium redolens]